ncbi:MAG: cytochrome c [Gemmatimonadetes bacterium]|nr:cytochrome c [Gemmatimonadota bacterium]
MCKPLWKKTLVAALVLCFGIQTGLVYSDTRSEPLSDAALAGRASWHRHACQTCHQLYGQGGFLGPDLTNAASRVDSTRLVSLLTVGSGQMPPFEMGLDEIAHLAAFLEEIDRPEIGRGQLRLGDAAEGGGVQAAFDRALDEALAGAEPSARGLAAIRARPCAACHFPFRESPVGAPDLSRVVETLSPDALDLVLAEGRPENGMPPPIPPLSEDERAAIAAFLTTLNERRDELEAMTRRFAEERSVDWGGLPWWEYP